MAKNRWIVAAMVMALGVAPHARRPKPVPRRANRPRRPPARPTPPPTCPTRYPMPDSTTPPSSASDDDTSDGAARPTSARRARRPRRPRPSPARRVRRPTCPRCSPAATACSWASPSPPTSTRPDTPSTSTSPRARRRRTRRASARATGAGRSPPTATAPYRTRVLVRMPADPADFSGTVVLEWLNVSGGADANPEWAGIHEEVIRAGSRVGRRVGADDRRDGRPGPRADELARVRRTPGWVCGRSTPSGTGRSTIPVTGSPSTSTRRWPGRSARAPASTVRRPTCSSPPASRSPPSPSSPTTTACSR